MSDGTILNSIQISIKGIIMIDKLNAKLEDRRKLRREIAIVTKEVEQLLEEASNLRESLAVHWDYEKGMDTLKVIFKYTIDEDSTLYGDSYTHGFIVMYPSERYPTLTSLTVGVEEALSLLVNEAFMFEDVQEDEDEV